jgi:FMN phosphatase YigB (HAD superfamily)
MRVISFDVFDTLLVRVQARPGDLFLQLGAELASAGIQVPPPNAFVRLRQQTELTARRKAPSGEVTLDEIYATLAGALGWDDATRTQARQRELDLEARSLKAIPAMLARVNAARTEADEVWFLSDMYLPAAFIERVLRREGFFRDGDKLFVSGEWRASKARGDLFTKAREQVSQPITTWRHIGDNPHADELVPRGQGIATEICQDAALNRYEQIACGPCEHELWRSLVAGAMRRARLANPETDPPRRVIWDTGCDVVGPLLFGFVHWCLAQAVERGLSRLYFVARDGQLLHRIAERHAPAWGFDIECRYLHGSRQAWHPAAADGADGLRKLALGYLRQEGLLDAIPWAIVDIGWHGNLQRSLGRVLGGSGAPPLVTGFYFGLLPGASVPLGDTATGYWNQVPANGHGVRRLNHVLCEIFLSADHGSVLGYREEAGRFVPQLREPRNERALGWGLAALQAAVLKFGEVFEEAMGAASLPHDWLAATRAVYLEFYRHPTRAEATTWGGIPFSDAQVEQDFHCLTPPLTGPAWSGILLRHRPLYWWTEGELAQRACWPLRLYLALRDLKRCIAD